IVVSPYSTSSIDNLFRAFASTAGVKISKIELSPADYEATWAVQQQSILDSLKNSSLSSGLTVVVVSEVCYATGLRTRLRDLIRALRVELSDLYVIVDGTNAVGNHLCVSIDEDWDSYVFAPSRWLMVTERCGVVISKRAELNSSADFGLITEGSRKRDEEV